MKLLINLNSDCSFWQFGKIHSEKIKKKFPGLEIITIGKDPDLKDLQEATIYFGWNFKEEWLDICENLKTVIVPSAGYDHIPKAKIEEKDILFLNMSYFHGIPMTEQIIGYILGFSRGLFLSKKLQEKEIWWKDEIRNNFFDLSGSTISIIGCGSVGKKLAKTLKSFNVNVIGVSRSPDISADYIEWIDLSEIKKAIKRSKVIVNLLPDNDTTKKFFNKKSFDIFQKGTIFINAGRGSTVDEKDLLDALESGKIGGCALDVFDPKPPLMTNGLRYHENVILTPKTSVFSFKYMDYAVDYFITLLSKIILILNSINSEYAKKKYVYIALKKYFNSNRLKNIFSEEYNNQNILEIIKKKNRNTLIEEFKKTGRNFPYLTLTVTNICDKNCIFCNPKNRQSTPLNIDDYREIAQESAKWGIKKLGITGGEPTLRKDLSSIIKIFREELGQDAQIGITTHGNFKKELIPELKECGITDINFSLHSLNEKNYLEIMRKGNPQMTIDNIKYAMSLGIKVKVNCTLMRSYINDAINMLDIIKELEIPLRFVELQKIGPAKDFFDKEFISEDEFYKLAGISLDKLITEKRDRFKVRSQGSYYSFEGWKGYLSVINTTSCPTCSDGNRIKITPKGMARPCTLNRDINIKKYMNEKNIEKAFKYLFFCIINRDSDPSHLGFHFIDYNLRWDNYQL